MIMSILFVDLSSTGQKCVSLKTFNTPWVQILLQKTSFWYYMYSQQSLDQVIEDFDNTTCIADDTPMWV